MNEDWYPGIRTFCSYWSHAPMLQHTFATLEKEFSDDNDACIDAAKAMVECACKVIVKSLDDPHAPLIQNRQNPSFGEWLSTAVRVMKLGDVRDEAFKKIVSQHYKLTESLGALRNVAGTVSHGKDGFLNSLSIHHRRAALLAADAIITFLHESYLEREPDPVFSMEPYDRFAESNAVIDRNTSIVANVDEAGTLEVEVIPYNDERFSLKIAPSYLLFSVDRKAYRSVLDSGKKAEITAAEDEEK